MYRVLIVDDERIIVDGLYEVFKNLAKLDIDVYKAYSGKEAVEWVNRTRFDIILTDIRMPEVDGLELMDEILKIWPQCKIIFLTGHDEFEYVYKAIQHKNISYILKTEELEKIINEVKKLLAEIEKETKIDDLIHKANEQINVAKELFQNDFFIHLLNGDLSINVNQEQFKKLSIPMHSNKPIILLVGHLENIPDDINYWEKVQYLYSIKVIINNNLNEKTRSVNIMDDNDRFIVFIQPKELFFIEKEKCDKYYYNKVKAFLMGTLEIIQATCKESLNASISFVLSEEPCKWERAYLKYDSLVELIDSRVSKGIETIITDKDINEKDNNDNIENNKNNKEIQMLDRILRQKKIDMIKLYLDSGQEEKYFKNINEILKSLKNIPDKNCNIAIETYYKLALIILSNINRYKMKDEEILKFKKDKLVKVYEFESWKKAAEYITCVSKLLFKARQQDQKNRTDNVIEYVQEYIEEHLNEDLSLIRLSEEVSLNPSYFSRLYKKVTGNNVSCYIDNLRIEKAKEFLLEDKKKIYEIAQLVGYDTPTSFTRFFRKSVGISPQEFQDNYLKSK